MEAEAEVEAENCEDVVGLKIISDAAANVDDAIGEIEEKSIKEAASTREATALPASSPARRRAICVTHFTRSFESHLGGGERDLLLLLLWLLLLLLLLLLSLLMLLLLLLLCGFLSYSLLSLLLLLLSLLLFHVGHFSHLLLMGSKASSSPHQILFGLAGSPHE